jgi:hypothetical protein
MCREIFDAYVAKLKTEKGQDGKLKNWWAPQKDDAFWENCWHVAEQSGLKFDGKHLTITQNGLTFDYVAYKNKMLQVYPDSIIDCSLVYKGDSFAFEKENGKVTYKHIINNPFEHEKEKLIGGYCVIKNKRGEFLTLLSIPEIEQAKKVAKTDAIWKAWYAEMCLKTVIKKAVKFHFDDIYTVMEEEDNKNYDLDLIEDKPEFPEALKNAIMEAADCTALKDIYKREYNNLSTAALKAEFIQLATTRKQELANASV